MLNMKIVKEDIKMDFPMFCNYGNMVSDLGTVHK